MGKVRKPEIQLRWNIRKGMEGNRWSGRNGVTWIGRDGVEWKGWMDRTGRDGEEWKWWNSVEWKG